MHRQRRRMMKGREARIQDRGPSLGRQGIAALFQGDALADDVRQVLQRLAQAAAGLALQGQGGGEEAVFGQRIAMRGLRQRLLDRHADGDRSATRLELAAGRPSGLHRLRSGSPRSPGCRRGRPHHHAEGVGELPEERLRAAAIATTEDRAQNRNQSSGSEPAQPSPTQRLRQAPRARRQQATSRMIHHRTDSPPRGPAAGRNSPASHVSQGVRAAIAQPFPPRAAANRPAVGRSPRSRGPAAVLPLQPAEAEHDRPADHSRPAPASQRGRPLTAAASSIVAAQARSTPA